MAHAHPSVLIDDRLLSEDGIQFVSSSTRQSWLLRLPPRRETVQTTNQLVRVTPRGNDRRSSQPKMRHPPKAARFVNHTPRTCLTRIIHDSMRQGVVEAESNRDTA